MRCRVTGFRLIVAAATRWNSIPLFEQVSTLLRLPGTLNMPGGAAIGGAIAFTHHAFAALSGAAWPFDKSRATRQIMVEHHSNTTA